MFLQPDAAQPVFSSSDYFLPPRQGADERIQAFNAADYFMPARLTPPPSFVPPPPPSFVPPPSPESSLFGSVYTPPRTTVSPPVVTTDSAVVLPADPPPVEMPRRREYGDEEGLDYARDLERWRAGRGYADGGSVQGLQDGGSPSLTPEQRETLRQFFVEPSTAPAEEPGFIAEEGFFNLQNRPGFDMRDLTDIVYNPSSKLDTALLPLMFFPPAAAAAKLAQLGYKGHKAVRAMERLGDLQRKIPGAALGNPQNKTRLLGGPTSGRRTYMQANVAAEPAEMIHGRYLLDRNQDPKEPEDFLTQPSGGR